MPHASRPSAAIRPSHRGRGVARGFRRFRRTGAAASASFLAVLGPGLLAGLSHDDPAGITTNSVLGTTLAPWRLAFMQSYAVDKRLTADDLPMERVEVVAGSILTGVIGMAIAVACAG